VLTGSSTSGIWSTEQAYRQRDASGALPNWLDYRHVHSYGALPMFVRDALRLNGPTQSVSTACSSSAKVFAAAARWIALGLCDAAVVGGVDSLCGTTIHGFHSLQLVATDPCRPFDASRSGISLGEAGAFALLERAPADGVAMRGRIALLGYGESADAHHMSSPHPEGLGAIAAMQGALAMSGLPPARVNHVCAHGTATRFNDETEARAARAVLGERCVVTSNKGIMGHTLGAAGAMSAVVSLLSIEHGVVPPTVNTVQIDPACAVDVPLTARESEVGAVLVNAFGFGGNNSSLVLGRVR
jgi:3-oxoacyl-[acyl-carrier-protein] synthase-1